MKTETDARVEYLIDRGWHTYYREDYWVHPDRVAQPSAQDYTNYGLNLDDAFAWQTGTRAPVPYAGDLAAALRVKLH